MWLQAAKFFHMVIIQAAKVRIIPEFAKNMTKNITAPRLQASVDEKVRYSSGTAERTILFVSSFASFHRGKKRSITA